MRSALNSLIRCSHYSVRTGVTLLGACSLALLCGPAAAFSDGHDSNGKSKLPQRGTLSTTVEGGNEGNSVDTFGNTPISDDTRALPITGSVSKMGRDFVMRVFNNSEDEYSINLEVLQKDKGGRTVKRNTYSYNMKANTDVSRDIKARTNAYTAALNITSWKNLSERKRKAKEKEEAAAEAKATQN